MNTVTTISLAGRSYTLEESGYGALKTYLAEAAKKLGTNPDKEEILKDFEAAIAEKCDAYLNANKNVITAGEVNAIIKDMGPVDGSTEQKTEEAKKAEPAAAKRLYRIREGQMIGGVCTGLAAYFNFDVTVIRLIAVILLLASHGFMILVYLIMMAVIPAAETPDEKARAFGAPTITAQKLVDNAKEGYANFKNSNEWRRWKQRLKAEKRRLKYERRIYRERSPFFELVGSVIGLIWFAFFIWLLWFGYTHIASIHNLFDAVGYAINQGADWIVLKASQ